MNLQKLSPTQEFLGAMLGLSQSAVLRLLNRMISLTLSENPEQANAPSQYASDRQGTPLHIAAFASNAQIFRILLKFKADVNATNGYGSTPYN